MSVFTTMMLSTWLASAGIEYKLVSSSVWMQRHFHGIKGMGISYFLSLAVGTALALTSGFGSGGPGMMIGAMLGLVTNEFTYKMFDRIHRFNVKRKEFSTKVEGFKAQHPTLVTEATGTIVGGLKTIGAILMFILFVIGIPYRTYQKLTLWRAGKTKTGNPLRKGVVAS